MIKIIITTIITIPFLLFIITGSKYDAMVEGLDSSEFPLKSLYCVGLGLCNMTSLAFPQTIYQKMISKVKLVYEEKYAQYYVNLIWAQIISISYFSIVCGMILSCVINSNLFILIGICLAAVFGGNFYNDLFSKVKNREDDCNNELADVVSTMALLINSGMVLKEAWNTVAYSKNGEIYRLMQEACDDMNNGMSEQDAIYRFGVQTNSAEVKKFTSTIIQGIEKGNRELSLNLLEQSSNIWDVKREYVLQKGEAAAAKLLAPIGMIFIGIIVLVISGAAGMLMS